MLRACVLDYGGSWESHLHLVDFVYNNSYQSSIKMAPHEALYGRPCRLPLCWAETSGTVMSGPEMIRETTEQVRQIKQRLLTAQSRQKSYANRRRRALEFAVGDRVFLRVAPRHGIQRFGRRGKLSPRYVGPFEVVERIGEVAYRLALSPNLARVHNVFHVSMIRKYHQDSSHVVNLEDVEINEDVTYEEGPVRIEGSREQRLSGKTIRLVLVVWRRKGRETLIWENEATMRKQFPALFETRGMSSV